MTGFANEYFRQQCVVAFHNLHLYLYVTFFFRHDLLLSLQPCSRRTFKRIKPSNAEAKKKIITSTRTQRNNMVHLALCSWIATVKFCDPQICGLSCTEGKITPVTWLHRCWTLDELEFNQLWLNISCGRSKRGSSLTPWLPLSSPQQL